MVQVQRPSRKQRIESAISHALDRRWDRAADENRALLDEQPNDVEAANRLGKALTELDDIAGAIAAYEQALKSDPTNAIARKNLARLEQDRASKRPARSTKAPAAKKSTPAAKPAARGRSEDGDGKAGPTAESIRTHSLIEESGKSAELELQQPNVDAFDDLGIGDALELETTQRGIAVRTPGGVLLGHLEPRAGLRLRRMIEGGNRYSAVVRRIEDGTLTVYIRETYKHPSLVGQASFLTAAADARRRRLAPRAYTKSSVLTYDRDVDIETDEDDEDDPWSGGGGETDEFEDSGFSAEEDEDFESDDVDTDDEPLDDDEDD